MTKLGTESQAPAPKLEIFIKGDPDNADITYYPYPAAGKYSKLLNYNFSEAVDDLEGSFSFSVENEEIKSDNGETKPVFDLIAVRSIVKIYEGQPNAPPVFVGIIRRRKIRKTMTSEGVKRAVVFSGKSIISCIAEYTVSLDVRIQGVADAMAKDKDLTTKLANIRPLTIKNFMEETWKHFKDVSEHAGISTTGIAKVIKDFIGSGPDEFVNIKESFDQELRYKVACVFYNATNNVIVDVWRHILPDKVYELFSRCEAGMPGIVARQVPFQPADWEKLEPYKIRPISLTEYDLEQSDEEVYTAFVSYILGSTREKEFYLAVNNTSNDSTIQYDKEKQKIYGYKPLDITFSGYDREGNAEGKERDELKEALKKLNIMAKDWYSRLDEMYSGTITVITDFRNPGNNPKVGCRAKFLGGEFYIERADHSWAFGGTPTIKLKVSRGMVYESGKMRGGKDGVVKNVGAQFRELEEETV